MYNIISLWVHSYSVVIIIVLQFSSQIHCVWHNETHVLGVLRLNAIFAMQSRRTHVLTQFHVLDWRVISDLTNTMNAVMKVQRGNRHTPILIHCRSVGWEIIVNVR